MYWLARHTLNDALQTMLSWKSPAPASQVRILTDAITHLHTNPANFDIELTPSEQLFSRGWDKLQPVTINLILGPTAANASKDLKADINALYAWLSHDLPTALLPTDTAKDKGCALPHHTTIQPWYLHLEFLKATLKLVDAAATLSKQKAHHSHSKVPAESVQSIKKVVKEHADLIQQRAKGMKERLAKSGVEEVIRAFRSGGAIGEAVAGVVGEQKMKRYAQGFVESGIEALEGLLKVKV